MIDKKFNHKLSIVMIAYNEEKNIERVIKEYYHEVFLKALDASDFTIYLDGSSDKTSEIVKRLANSLDLRIIYCKQNKGYFEAAKTALSYAKNDYVFFSDSSGKHYAKDFWNLATKITEYDIVTGLRVDRTDASYRKIITFIHRYLVSLLFSMPLYDYNTGFKLIRKKVLDSVLKECNAIPPAFSTELIIRAYRKGFTIANARVSFTHVSGRKNRFALCRFLNIALKQLIGLIKLRQELS